MNRDPQPPGVSHETIARESGWRQWPGTGIAGMRIALGLEYDGSRFSGFERQPDRRTVQGEVEEALTRIAATPVRVVCAGRTDAGVHASAQVVHFDTSAVRSNHAWVRGTNTYLSADVAVLWARSVDEDFHARFAALRRRYRYIIVNRSTRPALLAGRVTWEYRPVDARLMHLGAQHLVGEHDFSSFRAAGCQASNPVRRIERIEVRRIGEKIVIDVEANAYLQHMVRNIAGTLLAVGSGERDPAWVASVLAARDRTVAGVTAPPGGLYLAGIEYPQGVGIPAVPLSDALW